MNEQFSDDRLFPDAADKIFDRLTAYPGMTHGYILLAVLAVAFVVYCEWLRRRIVKRRERWAKRLAIVTLIGAMVFYPLSIGPAMWLRLSGYTPEWMNHVIWTLYEPVMFAGRIGPAVGKLLLVYIQLWTG